MTDELEESPKRKFINRYAVDNVDREWLSNFHAVRDSLEAPKGHNWTANQILVFNEGEALGRYDIKENRVRKISGKRDNVVYGVEPRGFEQMALLDCLMDPQIQLVFAHGIPGSGKSFLAIAAALEQIDGKNPSAKYDKIILMRPNSSVGRSMGMLPGDADEKYFLLVAPLLKLVDELAPQKLDWMVKEGKIIAQPIEYIRGETFKNSIVVLDEAQNVDNHVMKTIITRMDLTSKLYVCGDTRQVDERGDMRTRNGLTEGMRHMQLGKDEDVAIVELFKSERKGISQKAALRMEDY